MGNRCGDYAKQGAQGKANPMLRKQHGEHVAKRLDILGVWTHRAITHFAYPVAWLRFSMYPLQWGEEDAIRRDTCAA